MIKLTPQSLKERYAIILMGNVNDHRIKHCIWRNEAEWGIHDDNDRQGYLFEELAELFDNYAHKIYGGKDYMHHYTAEDFDCEDICELHELHKGERPTWFESNGWYENGQNGCKLYREDGGLYVWDKDNELCWSYMSLNEIDDLTDGDYWNSIVRGEENNDKE